MKGKFFILAGILSLFLSVNAYGGDILIFGAMNFFNSSGSASDYKEGENDFPIAKSHQNPCFGLGIYFPLLAEKISIGIEGNYNTGGKATLEDPSDNDTVEIDTRKNANLFLTLRFKILGQNSFNIFLNGGAGINYILERETRIYTSKLGYETEILAPERRANLTGFGGVGILYRMSKSIALLLNARYLYISLEDNPQNGFVLLGGLNIGF